MQLSEQEIIRREKLKGLRELGINPYPADLYPVKNTSKQVKENFEDGVLQSCKIAKVVCSCILTET
jgi:lysyl-tRNA synthetase class 2